VEAFATGEMPAVVENGQVASFDILSRESLVPGDGARWALGRQIRMDLRYPERPGSFRSDYVLWYFPSYRAKVRVTWIDTPERAAALAAFLAELTQALVAPSR